MQWGAISHCGFVFGLRTCDQDINSRASGDIDQMDHVMNLPVGQIEALFNSV
jgi:hypothetical protein